jgi:hypothetical protein
MPALRLAIADCIISLRLAIVETYCGGEYALNDRGGILVGGPKLDRAKTR